MTDEERFIARPETNRNGARGWTANSALSWHEKQRRLRHSSGVALAGRSHGGALSTSFPDSCGSRRMRSAPTESEIGIQRPLDD